MHEEELEKLETEKRLEMTKLELLKSQINPHFLFNTLNVIGGMASLEEAETTEKMIRALSALFRYNLKNQDTEVCLSQELKIMEDYMYLQQMRFGDRITYRKDCSVDADKVIVPAFTFQPLVENAIIHGLSKKEEGGTVRVHIWQKDGFTLITIGDNGLGMDEAALMHLRGELEKEDGKTGIGLGNIFRRIRAMYQDGNVEIYSKKDVGTVVKIQIRHKEVGEHDVPCVGGGYEPIERMIVGRTIKKYFSGQLEVVEAVNGGRRQSFYRKDCKIALLDIEMPGDDGLRQRSDREKDGLQHSFF